jgi:hypothetical protein
MWFHCAILDIFRPFTTASPNPPRLRSFTSPDATPHKVFNASLDQLKCLALLYKIRTPSTQYATYVNTSLLHIANAALKEAGSSDATDPNPSWRFYFMLCVRYWQDLYTGYPIYRDIAQAFLSMAVRDRAISGAEANTLMRELRARSHGHGADGETTADGKPASTRIIADFDLAAKNREEAQVAAMANKFEDVTLFNEFTNV